MYLLKPTYKTRLKLTAILLFIYAPMAVAEELEPITVESSAFDNQTTEDFAQSVSVITAKELNKKKNSSIGETLSRVPGVSSTYFGPGASRPIIRGLGSNRVRILENGIDTLDASSVSDDHAVSIEPYNAEQIEVIRGPATLRYGPGAVGGIVNIINYRLPQQLSEKAFNIDLDLEHATVSDGNTASVDLNGTVGSFVWHLDGLTRDTNDYDIDGFANEDAPENKGRLRNSAIETDSYGLGGSYIGEKGMLGFAFSRMNTDYGIPGTAEGDVRIDLNQYRYDAQAELFAPFSNVESISIRTGFNNYRHFEVEESGEIATTFDNEELESRLEIVMAFSAAWKNVFGVQYNDREFSAVGEEAFIQPLDEKRYGAFAISRFETGLWDLELGGRIDHDEFKPEVDEDENFSLASLSFGAIRELTHDMHLNIFLAHSQRAPQETALYADGPHLATLTFERGNSDLDKEIWNNIELGLGQDKKTFSWQVNAFYNRVDDYVYLASVDDNSDGIVDLVDEDGMFDPMGELLLGDYANEDAEFYGLEAQLTNRLHESTTASIDGRLFGDFVRAKFRDDDEGYVPRIPPARIGLGIDVLSGLWDASFDWIYVAKQYATNDLETETNSYNLVNTQIGKTIYVSDMDVHLFVRGENLLDEDARRHSSFQKDRVPLPGRNLVFGLSLSY